MMLSFVTAQVGTEVACFQQGPKLRTHIRKLDEQISYSTKVFFHNYKLPNFVVKNVYGD